MKKDFPPLRRVTVNDWSISCILQTRGRESIVFVHGFGASKETFVEAFGREEFRSFSMVATDLIGFGDSDKPANFSYLMKD